MIVYDGTAAAARCIGRVMWNNPANGITRHADAGHKSATACAKGTRWAYPA